MLSMTPRRTRPAFPEWLRDRRGYDAIAAQLPEEVHEYTGEGPWNFQLTLPANLREVVENEIDPLVLLAVMNFLVSQADDGINVLVRLCRDLGASWTQIGEVLGMSKQAAWERFSGEE